MVRRTKTDAAQEIPLNAVAADAFRQLAELVTDGGRVVPVDLPEHLVFPGHRRGGGYPVDLRRPFHEALAKAGVKDFTWHDLRHSFASALLRRGAPESSISRVLGHSSLKMTARYSHLTRDRERAAVELLDGRTPAQQGVRG